MAGDWIKMRSDLVTDPDVIRIADCVGVDRYAVVGRLHEIWTWADKHSVDGHAVSVTGLFLDELISCDGFANAMRSVGWLSGRDWALEFPNFERHNGKSAKKRAVDASRKDRSRNPYELCHGDSVTERGPEKRREDKSIKKKTPSSKKFDPLVVDLPAELRTDVFAEAWAAWVTYRREKRSPITASTAKKQLATLAKAGSDVATKMIEQSIEQGWIGLFELKEQRERKSESASGSGSRVEQERQKLQRILGQIADETE